jgi:hypothetical protein
MGCGAAHVSTLEARRGKDSRRWFRLTWLLPRIDDLGNFDHHPCWRNPAELMDIVIANRQNPGANRYGWFLEAGSGHPIALPGDFDMIGRKRIRNLRRQGDNGEHFASRDVLRWRDNNGGPTFFCVPSELGRSAQIMRPSSIVGTKELHQRVRMAPLLPHRTIPAMADFLLPTGATLARSA